MSGTLINLIIQIIAGIVGGHAAGATLKNFTLCKQTTHFAVLLSLVESCERVTE